MCLLVSRVLTAEMVAFVTFFLCGHIACAGSSKSSKFSQVLRSTVIGCDDSLINHNSLIWWAIVMQHSYFRFDSRYDFCALLDHMAGFSALQPPLQFLIVLAITSGCCRPTASFIASPTIRSSTRRPSTGQFQVFYMEAPIAHVSIVSPSVCEGYIDEKPGQSGEPALFPGT